jgi:FdhE protein
MSINFALDIAQVENAIKKAKNENPAYAEMLEFYGRLFIVQEESKNRLQIEPLQIPDDILDLKKQEKFPLVEVKDFTYDAAESTDLFARILKLAHESNPKLAESATAINRALDTNLKPDILFNALLNGNETLYENMAEALQVEKQILGLLAYNSIKPSLSTAAEQLAAYLKLTDPWLKGYCPICGSSPILSFLDDEGARSLNCSFCWHNWQVKRVYCPFCENSDNKELEYLYNEEERELRIDLCNNCRRYLKSIDTRKLDRLIYPPLEQVITLHLDIKAREEGFEPGIKLYLGG